MKTVLPNQDEPHLLSISEACVLKDSFNKKLWRTSGVESLFQQKMKSCHCLRELENTSNVLLEWTGHHREIDTKCEYSRRKQNLNTGTRSVRQTFVRKKFNRIVWICCCAKFAAEVTFLKFAKNRRWDFHLKSKCTKPWNSFTHFGFVCSSSSLKFIWTKLAMDIQLNWWNWKIAVATIPSFISRKMQPYGWQKIASLSSMDVVGRLDLIAQW